MSKCTQCPWEMGDIHIRDCSFPDCVGGWENAFDNIVEQLTAKDNECEAVREALQNTLQRLNESGTGEVGLLDTIYDAHHILKQALAGEQP